MNFDLPPPPEADPVQKNPCDYRRKLKARFSEIKKRNPNFSIAVLARKVGCSSSYIKKLFACRAHLGFRYAENLALGLELSESEEEQLFLIVIFHSIENERFKELMNRIIVGSKKRT